MNIVRLINSYLTTRCVWCDEHTGVLVRVDGQYDWICIDCFIFTHDETGVVDRSVIDQVIVPPGFDDDLPSSDDDEEPEAIPKKEYSPHQDPCSSAASAHAKSMAPSCQANPAADGEDGPAMVCDKRQRLGNYS